jgi:hypothetical protein
MGKEEGLIEENNSVSLRELAVRAQHLAQVDFDALLGVLAALVLDDLLAINKYPRAIVAL